MNKKAGLFSSIMLCLVLFMVGMIVVNFIMPEVTNTRSDLTCTAPATDGTKVLCLLTDITIPYFIVLVLSIAGGLILDHFLI